MKVSKVGIAWFREGEYEAFRKLFVDGEGLPETYDKWFQIMDGRFNEMRREGKAVVKAYLHIDTFPEWCRTHGMEINSAARTRFAAWHAARDDSD